MQTQTAVVGSFDVLWMGAIPPGAMVTTLGGTDTNASVVIRREVQLLPAPASSNPAPVERVFAYHCRGPVKAWPVPEYLRREPAANHRARVRHRSQQAGAFVDALSWQDTPFLRRPQAKQLDSLLTDGDHVVIALSDFNSVVEAAEVIGGWWRRGVHFHVTDLPDSCDDDRILMFRVLARLVRTNEPWIEPAEERQNNDDGPIFFSPI
jgi:hypothetical protein